MTHLLKMTFTSNHIKLISLSGLTLLIIALMISQQANAEGSRIVKWKDDKGVTQYGDKIPPQYANRENTVINKQGITVQRNKPASFTDQAADQAKIEQDKKDKALLSAFTSENEIDLARDRNLQLDQVTLEGLQLQKTNSQKRLNDSQKYVDGFTKKKKPVPVDLANEHKSNQADIAKIDKQIAERKASMDATRRRFDDDKKRYIMLKNPSASSVATP